MRELDFSEKNVAVQWSLVKGFWRDFQRQTIGYVKRSLEKVMRVELAVQVGCGRHERSERRRGYRNGSYGRELLTTYGWIGDLSVPRLRCGGLSTAVFERYRRRQGVIDRVLLEAFLLGHSTRKVRRLVRQLFGVGMSAQTVSGLVQALDDEVTAFHRRSLTVRYECVYLDGLWITVTRPVKMKKVILVALGRDSAGQLALLSFQVAPSESEASWWGFLGDLKERGLKGMELLISDGAAGLVKALTALYPRVPQQRCVIHKIFDLRAALVTPRHWTRLQADAFHIFEATTETEARHRLRAFISRWSRLESRAVRVFLRQIETCFTYFRFPPPRHRTLKSTNPVERYLEEIRRRLIPMRSFNNSASVNRIVYGLIAYVLNQQSDMPSYEFTQFT
jgi:putative transposase